MAFFFLPVRDGKERQGGVGHDDGTMRDEMRANKRRPPPHRCGRTHTTMGSHSGELNSVSSIIKGAAAKREKG